VPLAQPGRARARPGAHHPPYGDRGDQSGSTGQTWPYAINSAGARCKVAAELEEAQVQQGQKQPLSGIWWLSAHAHWAPELLRSGDTAMATPTFPG